MDNAIPITARWETAPGVSLASPANVPTVTIRRIDTMAAVVTAAAMIEVGEGVFSYNFVPPDKGLVYSAVADGDPIAASQVPAEIRFQSAQFDAKLPNIWTTLGLDPADPATITDNSITTPSGVIDQTLTGDGVTTRTITRD